MAYTGSMSTGETIRVMQRANPHVRAIVGSTDSVGILNGATQVGAVSKLGSLPPRTVFDSDGVIECRGWMDVLGLMLGNHSISPNKELVRLLGHGVGHAVRTGSLLPSGTDEYPSTVYRSERNATPSWLPQGVKVEPKANVS